MRRLLCTCLLGLGLWGSLCAQSCTERLEEGIAYHDKGEYDNAILVFEIAEKMSDCPSQSKVSEWLSKTRQARIDDLKQIKAALERSKQQLELSLIEQGRLREKQEQLREIAEKARDSIQAAKDSLRDVLLALDRSISRNDTLFYLSEAQSLAAKSFYERNPDLRVKLALEAFELHTRFGGDSLDTGIYRSMYESLSVKSGYKRSLLRAKHRAAVTDLRFSDHRDTLYSQGADGRELMYEGLDSLFSIGQYVQDQQKKPIGSTPSTPAASLTELPRLFGKIHTLLLHPLRRQYALANAKGELWIVSTDSTKSYLRVLPDMHRAYSLAIHPSGAYLAVGTKEGFVYLYRWEAPEPLALEPFAVLPGHEARVSALSFNADGRLLASASYDRTVQVWDVSSDTPESKLPLILNDHADWITALTFHPTDPFVLASGCQNGELHVWPILPQSYVKPLRSLTGDLEPSTYKRSPQVPTGNQ